jgi:ribonuclease-3
MKPRDLKELETALGHRFRRAELLELALTHSSHARELESNPPVEIKPARKTRKTGSAPPAGGSAVPRDNEQLEFLGDAVLGLVTSRALYERFPQFREGQLSKLRAHLVSGKHLLRAANKLKIGRYLRLGHGEEKSGGRKKATLQVDATEALLAALYLDGGLEKTRQVILSLIIDPELKRRKRQVAQGLPFTDFKSALQEALHSSARPQPQYALIKEEGPQHQKRFTVEARIFSPGNQGRNHLKPEFAGHGEGTTKKKAEQEAAHEAVKYLWSLAKVQTREAREKRATAAKT